MSQPKIAIIIVNWNGKHLLEECLSSVENQDYDNYKIIFVDNGSKDKSVEFEFPTKIDDVVDLNSILDDDIRGSEISEIAKFNVDKNLKEHKKYKEIKNKKLLLAYEIRKSRTTFRYDNLSPTLTAKMGTGGNNVPVLVSQMRKLTTRECLRIQGYPDSYLIEANKAQSYKQIGNSVSVPVVSLLACEINTILVSQQ